MISRFSNTFIYLSIGYGLDKRLSILLGIFLYLFTLAKSLLSLAHKEDANIFSNKNQTL